jgi:hypothetical protein
VARSRAQRRRRTLLIVAALAVTLIVLVFARDVTRAAHGAITARRSENRSFAALANALATRENAFDGRLALLLADGGGLSRPVFAARLDQLDDELASWSTAADLVRRPVLAHDVNDALDELTQERVAAYATLLDEVAQALSLPWSGARVSAVADPAAVLVATSTAWNHDRFALAKEPGRAILDATSARSAVYVTRNGFSALEHAPSLALVRAISLAAVRVSPSPLPARPGVLLLPPVGTVRLGVSVLNDSFDEQPVRLSVRVTPLNGRGSSSTQSFTATVGPLQGFAFTIAPLRTAASEQARVVISVVGARAARGKVTTETFRLEMSPSGNPAPA